MSTDSKASGGWGEGPGGEGDGHARRWGGEVATVGGSAIALLWLLSGDLGAIQSILDDGPPLRHELHLPALLPQPVLQATSSTIVTRSCPPDAINAGRSLKWWCSEPCAT